MLGVPPDSADREALLADAARLVGAEHLPELREALRTYLRERALAGEAPRAKALLDLAQRKAERFAAARRELRMTPWEELLLDRPDDPVLEEHLAERERAYRQIEGELAERIRRRTDLMPGGPRWRFTWALAELFTAAGKYVGIGSDTDYFDFAAAMYRAAGEEPIERHLREVATRWQERAHRTLQGLKSSEPSFTAG
jgi:hypothetical protein